MNIEMISIDGFDAAIIGTGIRAIAKEVLVYDADACEKLLRDNGFEDPLSIYLESIDVDSLGDRAPLFIYLDSNADDKLDESKGKPKLRLVH